MCYTRKLSMKQKRTNAISINSLLTRDATNSPSHFSKIIQPAVLCLEEIHATQRKLLCFQHRGLEIQEANGTEMFGEFNDNVIPSVWWSSNFTQTIWCHWEVVLLFGHWWEAECHSGQATAQTCKTCESRFREHWKHLSCRAPTSTNPKKCHSLSKSRKTTRRRRAFFEGTSDLRQGFTLAKSKTTELLPILKALTSSGSTEVS